MATNTHFPGSGEFVLYDCEFTAWEGSMARSWSAPGEHREVVQLAALRLSVNGSHIVKLAQFNLLVKPAINPQLSDYFSELTGITQAMVDQHGVDFQSAISQFHSFCHLGSAPAWAWGKDAEVLAENAHLSGIALPSFAAGLHDLHQYLADRKFDEARFASGELAKVVGEELRGHAHNALFDVESVVVALNYWSLNGRLNPVDLLRLAGVLQQRQKRR